MRTFSLIIAALCVAAATAAGNPAASTKKVADAALTKNGAKEIVKKAIDARTKYVIDHENLSNVKDKKDKIVLSRLQEVARVTKLWHKWNTSFAKAIIARNKGRKHSLALQKIRAGL